MIITGKTAALKSFTLKFNASSFVIRPVVTHPWGVFAKLRIFTTLRHFGARVVKWGVIESLGPFGSLPWGALCFNQKPDFSG